MAILAGEKVVALATTAQAIAVPTACSSVIVQAKTTNTDVARVGNATTQHFELSPGQSVGLAASDLSHVYVDVAVNGEGVNYLGVS
jgi:hypothetical protein